MVDGSSEWAAGDLCLYGNFHTAACTAVSLPMGAPPLVLRWQSSSQVTSAFHGCCGLRMPCEKLCNRVGVSVRV